MDDCFNPTTGEHIATANPAGWMGRAGTPAPAYDPQAASAIWAGSNWSVVQATPPEVPVPQLVSRFQAIASLHLSGLLPAIEAYMSDPSTDELTKIAWANAQEFRRDSPMIASLAVLMGWTESQLDDLFRTASTIQA